MQAVEKQITGTGAGEGFLEKIVDFRFRIPDLDRDARVKFLTLYTQKIASFFPVSTIDALAELLPDTPRRLKAVARQISLLRGTIKRHDADEVNWPAVLFWTILRQENERFSLLFFEQVISVPDNPYTITLEKTAARDERREKITQELLQTSNVADPRSKERIKKIVQYYWRNLAQPGARWVNESIRLVRTPPVMTQKELSEFIVGLEVSTNGPGEIRKAFSARGISIQDGFARIAHTLESRYSNNLTDVSEAFTKKDRTGATAEAKRTVRIFKRLVKDSKGLSPPTRAILFTALYHVAAHYQVTVPEILRKMEQATLLALIETADDSELMGIDEVIRDDGTLDEKEFGKRVQLSRAMVAKIMPRIASDIIRRFKLPAFRDFIKDLHYRSIYRRVLQEPTSPLWVGPLRRRWNALLLGSRISSTVRMNAVELLQIADTHFVVSAVNASPEGEHILIPTLWRAATAQPLGVVWQWRLRRDRDALIGRGEKAEALPFPNWFEDRVRE
jgi:hypothetical protein